MKKEQFVQLVNALVSDLEYKKKLSALNIEMELSESFGAIEEFLKSEIDLNPQPEYGDDLSYFLYETDCGKKWDPGMITVSGTKDMPLRNAEDLWELITYKE